MLKKTSDVLFSVQVSRYYVFDLKFRYPDTAQILKKNLESNFTLYFVTWNKIGDFFQNFVASEYLNFN